MRLQDHKITSEDRMNKLKRTKLQSTDKTHLTFGKVQLSQFIFWILLFYFEEFKCADALTCITILLLTLHVNI